MFKNIVHFIVYMDFNLVTIFPLIRPGTSILILNNNNYLRTLLNSESLKFLTLEVILNIHDKQ